jgi:hypothetical protein
MKPSDMSPTGLQTKNGCTDEGQQQITTPDQDKNAGW